MKIIGKISNDKIATVYIAKIRGKMIELVESLSPPLKRRDKWILMVSTLFGCPVKCIMCDAGGNYYGKLTKEEIFAQINHIVKKYFPERNIEVKKFKIQFARIGEPSFNDAVLDVLEEFHSIYDAKGFIPSISTIAPKGKERFFEKLKSIKNKKYRNGKFQLQFSIHTTNEILRDRVIPIPKWSFKQIAEYSKDFYKEGDRKITLNFALAKEFIIEPEVLVNYFDPEIFLIKITPINPTLRVQENKLNSYIDIDKPYKNYEIVEKISSIGYDVIVSIGELEENKIGSNCGQYITSINRKKVKGAYEYSIEYVYNEKN